MQPPITWPPVVWLFLAEAAGYLWLLWESRGRRTPGLGAFRGIVCGAMLFLVAEALIMVSADPALRFAFTCGSFLSPGLIAPCVAFLFAERTGWALWNRPTIQRALLAGGLALAGLRVFDPWTGWVSDLATEGVRRDFGIHVILYSPGWGYTAILAMCAAAATFCVVATVRAWPESSPLQRRQLLPMVLACVPPLVTEVLFNLNPSLTYNIDPTPGVLGVTVSLMGWAVLCSGFVAVAPVARAYLFEHLSKAVVATDAHRSVIDYNPAAARALGWQGSSAIGNPLDKQLENWPTLAELSRRDTATTAECHFGNGPESRFWEAAWHPLMTTRHGRRLGYLLVLSDVTERKRNELALAEALAARTTEWERATKAAVSAAEEERCRIGRALHDGVCQDLVGLVHTTEAILAAGGSATRNERLAGLVERLHRVSEHTRGVAHLLEGPDLAWTSLEEALEAMLAQFESQFGLSCDLTFSPHFPKLEPEPARSFLRIVREAAVNAVRHGGARRIWIDLTCHAGAATAVATISNNGTPPPARPTEGLGLRQMRMRAALLGAQLTLEPGSEGCGACVRLLLPVPSPHAPTSAPTP